MKFVRFIPKYQSRVWGGDSFGRIFGREIDRGSTIGESWEICDREGNCSLAKGGRFDGMSLRRILGEFGEYIMGEKWEASRRFPVLVKWLDCRERLSLQVHPTAAAAAALCAEEKNENWYVAHSSPDAAVIAGFSKKSCSEDFCKAVEDGEAEGLLRKIHVAKGDSIYIPSGTVHAICGGSLILEIQDNSDTTYRIFDWNRTGLDGKPRALHLKDGLASADFSGVPVVALHTADTARAKLCAAKNFTSEIFRLNEGEKFSLSAGNGAHVVGVVEGSLGNADGAEMVKLSENVLVPAAEDVEFFARSKSALVVSKITA